MAFCLERGSEEAFRGNDDAFGGENGSRGGGREMGLSPHNSGEGGIKGRWGIR